MLNMTNQFDDLLRPLQLEELGILKIVDSICRKHELHYSLHSGTLLGAIRHGGFIPWDDDLDICMPREDYNRFIQIWFQDPPSGYFLQNKDNSPLYSQSFTKIRKEHTTFLQDTKEIGRYNPGIFIDIFPIDRIPSGLLNASLFRISGYLYNLLVREYVPENNGVVMRLGSRLLLVMIPPKARQVIRNNLLYRLTRYNNNTGFNCIGVYTFQSLKREYPSDLLDDYSEISFEDGKFMCFSAWKSYLSITYGDYMKMPPESERTWKHHPIILDFEHDYEELTRLGKTDRIPGL